MDGTRVFPPCQDREDWECGQKEVEYPPLPCRQWRGTTGADSDVRVGLPPLGPGLRMGRGLGSWQWPWVRGLAHCRLTTLGAITSWADLSQSQGTRSTSVDTGYRLKAQGGQEVHFILTVGPYCVHLPTGGNQLGIFSGTDEIWTIWIRKLKRDCWNLKSMRYY